MIFSLVPNLVSILVTIVTIPLFVQLLGTERYGLLILVFVILGYFGQADFGIGRALTQRLAMIRDAPPKAHASLVWSAIAGASIISVAGAGAVYLAAETLLRSLADTDAAIRQELLRANWLLAACVPVIMFTGVGAGALNAVERFGMVSIGTTIGGVLSQVFPLLVAAFISVEFVGLVAASLAGRLIGLVPIIASMWTAFLHGQPCQPRLEHMRSLFSFGSWIMLTALVGPMMMFADRIVIGMVLGATAVVAYSVPFQVAWRTVLFPSAVVQALFPRMAGSDVAGSHALGVSAVIVVGQLYAFVVVGLVCLAEPLLGLWLGEQLDPRSALVGQIILVGLWINGLAIIPFTLIQAQGNSRFTALCHLAELPLYVAMLYGFGTILGLAGAALAFSLRVVIDCAVLFLKAGYFQGKVLFALAGPAAIVAAAFWTAQGIDGLIPSLIAATIFSLILLVLTLWQMPPEVRAVVRRWVGAGRKAILSR